MDDVFADKLIKISKSKKETQKLATDLATKIVKSREPVVIALEGELGAGKTTFVQGFTRALGIRSKVKSPTFVLMKKYKIPQPTTHNLKPITYLYHLDCYRVRDHRDLATLDLKTIFNEPHNIVLIEWPERISKILPKKLTRVHIDHINKSTRKITIS